MDNVNTPGKTIGLIFGSLFVGIGLILTIVILSGGAQYLTAPFRGAVDAQEQTQASGSYRISAYESFYNQCASVQADEDRLNNLREERETANEARQAQLDTTITAVRNSRDEKIRSYNSEARQEATRGQFRDSDLPYELNTDDETTCYAEGSE